MHDHHRDAEDSQIKGLLPNMDPGETPRLETILRCLYASLSLSIPIQIIQISGLSTPAASFWISPISQIFTLIFASTLVMVTFRDRARLHPNSRRSAPSVPVLCHLPAIISCFLIVVFWIVSAALLILRIVYSALDTEALLLLVMSCIELVFVLAQIGVLLTVGILAVKERKSGRW